MLFKKNHCRLTLVAGVLPLLLFSACKKIDTKEPVSFSIKALMPNTNTPIPGVKYKIVEYKGEEATGWELSGETGSDGRVSGSFKGVIKSNYDYTIYFDYSGMEIPEGLTDISVMGPQFDILFRNSPNDNVYTVRVLPYTGYHFKLENVNCFDSNDRMRFRMHNYDEWPYYNFDYIPWSNYFDGCGVHVDHSNNHVLGGHQVYQIEVTRNGEVTTYIDTFNLLPNQMNEVFIEY